MFFIEIFFLFLKNRFTAVERKLDENDLYLKILWSGNFEIICQNAES
jgi:hypothetical protein